MLVVGVDFGTTNVRIATWDPGEPNSVPLPVEFGGATTMPAVIAFQRHQGGEVTTVVGADADQLVDGDNTVVVRNLKRWAFSHDPYVRWGLESKNIRWESWWDPENRAVNVWGNEFPVKELVKRILEEAFYHADLAGQSFEWRAGCPVHSGLDFRTELAQVMSELSGNEAKAGWVIEEPILFLVLALNLGTLSPGSYMVYDVGGGSFDCALAEVQEDRSMVVYAADGDPLLGGANIDELLKELLCFTGSISLLRLAKEQLTEATSEVPVDADTKISITDVETAVSRSRFLGSSLLPMRLAYITAKTIWKTEGTSPIAADVPSCKLGQLPTALGKDLNGIILFGGPTRSPVFLRWLQEKFGEDKVICPEDLVRGQVRDPHLTAISAGACYATMGAHNPLYTRRLPIKVTLRNAATGDSVEYTPYEHFARNFNPVRPFKSRNFVPQSSADADYHLSVADADGNVLIGRSIELKGNRQFTGGYDSPRVVIDSLGQIWVENCGQKWLEVGDPPWQTGRQREILQAKLEEQRKYEEQERGRTHRLITANPYGWQSGHA